jgi:hypothetical protein
MTEVHILSAASNYTQFALHAATALGTTYRTQWQFAFAPNGDLVGVDMNGTGSGMTEVHILSAASNYTQFSDHLATALGSSSPQQWQFAIAPNRDLVAVKMNGTGSSRTEVHILSAASNYTQFALHAATALAMTNPTQWSFQLRGRDLVGVDMNGTGSGRTEVHILSAASNYTQFSDHWATALGSSSPQQWQFNVAPNGDLVAVKMNGTDSGRTEVHILSAASNYTQFAVHAASALAMANPYSWSFGSEDPPTDCVLMICR